MALRIEDLYEPGQVLPYLELPDRPVNVAVDAVVKAAVDLAKKLAGDVAPLASKEQQLAHRARDTYNSAWAVLRAVTPIKGNVGAARPKSQIQVTEEAVQNFGEAEGGRRDIERALGEPDLTTERPDFGYIVDQTDTYVRGARNAVERDRPVRK